MRSRALVWALTVAAALTFPGASLAARYTLGLRPAADPASVAAAVEHVTGKRPASLAPLRALSAVGRPRELRAIPGVAWVERDRVRRVAFVPTDPLAPRQWYALRIARTTPGRPLRRSRRCVSP